MILHVFMQSTCPVVLVVGLGIDGEIVNGYFDHDSDPFLLKLTNEVLQMADRGNGKVRPFLGGVGWVYEP